MWRVGGVLKPWHVHRGALRTWETLCAPEGTGRDLQPKGKATKVHWESDRFILGRAYAAEGNDSHVEDCGSTHIPDNVELESI